MTTQSSFPVSAALFGLEAEIADELARALRGCCRSVDTVNPARPPRLAADVIFCPADVDQVKQLKSEYPAASVVVASRHPEVSDWLDALEAGASDYCAAPFEQTHLLWLLESHVRASA